MSGLRDVLAAHRYRDVLGDYETAPYYKHFGCSCGWEQNIAGMSGWWSWVAAHEAHVETAALAWLDDLLGGDGVRERVAEAIRAKVWGDDTADDWSVEADAALAVVREMVGGGA